MAGLAIRDANARPFRRRKLSRKASRMTDRGAGTEGGDDSAILIPLHEARRERLDMPVAFDRRELDQILQALRAHGRRQ